MLAGNGGRQDFTVAQIVDGGYVPLGGVTWILPPTSVSDEILVGLEEVKT